MDNTEIWKEIPGYEGYYSVSNQGRVRSEDRTITRLKSGIKEKHKGVILKPWIAKQSGKGYLMVSLSRGTGRSLKIGIHRLILWAFVGIQEKGIDARHLDGNCKNNTLSNLEYGTRSDNLKDAAKHLTIMRPQKLTRDDVIEICKMGRNKISSKIVGEKYNIDRNTVTEIWRGEIWGHATQGLLPESNQPKKYDKISDEHKRIIMDIKTPISHAAKIVGVERHTAARWRKRFLNEI